MVSINTVLSVALYIIIAMWTARKQYLLEIREGNSLFANENAIVAFMIAPVIIIFRIIKEFILREWE